MEQSIAPSSTMAIDIRETTSITFPAGQGDITLITIDNVVFHAHRAVLRHSSHVFETILEKADDESYPPRLKIEAEASTLDHLLAFTYPNKLSPSIQDVNVLAAIFRAAKRYEMDGVLQQLNKGLLEITIVNNVVEQPMYIKAPLAVLALSYAFDCTVVGRFALRECIKGNLEEHLAGASNFDIPAELLSEILRLRQKRMELFEGFLSDLPWYTINCFNCGRRQAEWRGQIIRDLSTRLHTENFRTLIDAPPDNCITGHVSVQTVPKATFDGWSTRATALEETFPALPQLSR